MGLFAIIFPFLMGFGFPLLARATTCVGLMELIATRAHHDGGARPLFDVATGERLAELYRNNTSFQDFADQVLMRMNEISRNTDAVTDLTSHADFFAAWRNGTSSDFLHLRNSESGARKHALGDVTLKIFSVMSHLPLDTPIPPRLAEHFDRMLRLMGIYQPHSEKWYVVQERLATSLDQWVVDLSQGDQPLIAYLNHQGPGSLYYEFAITEVRHGWNHWMWRDIDFPMAVEQ